MRKGSQYMSETLLDKAISNYNVAVMVYNAMDGDESYLNYIGYHLQQSVELGLKYVLDENGVSYPKTHDIDQLLLIANRNNIDTFATDYIKDHSEMFSLWESRTRYVLDYRLELSKVEKAMDGVDRYLDVLKENEIQHEQETSDPNPNVDDVDTDNQDPKHADR